MDSQIRSLRIVHGAMLFAAVLYVFLAEKLKAGTQSASNNTFYTVISLQTILLVAIAFFFRKRYVTDTEDKLRQQPANGFVDQALLKRWRTGNIVCFAFAESVVLFGMVLRFIGTPPKQTVPFYVVGILLLLWFAPRRPE